MDNRQQQDALAAFARITANYQDRTVGHDAEAGRTIIEKTYGKSLADVARALPVRPGTSGIDKSIRQGQDLVDHITSRAYQDRARDTAAQPQRETHGNNKEKLVLHMLRLKTSIEAQVDNKQLRRDQGDAAFRRIHQEIFDRPTPRMNREFTSFEKNHNNLLGREVREEVDRRYALALGKSRQPPDTERLKIAEAVASRLIGDKLSGQNTTAQQQVIERIQEGLRQRMAEDRLPEIRIYDSKSKPKARNEEKHLEPERLDERTR
ncbi:MAG: hypothetical protein LBI87_00965 [Candidatus Accumulibacter sp.]|jgi:hypothetical protein|nr:hypothetical protein [Accumulibacter sp.]